MSAQDFRQMDAHFEALSQVTNLSTVLDIIDIRLKAGVENRTTLHGLRESVQFTREYIARMKGQRS